VSFLVPSKLLLICSVLKCCALFSNPFATRIFSMNSFLDSTQTRASAAISCLRSATRSQSCKRHADFPCLLRNKPLFANMVDE